MPNNQLSVRKKSLLAKAVAGLTIGKVGQLLQSNNTTSSALYDSSRTSRSYSRKKNKKRKRDPTPTRRPTTMPKLKSGKKLKRAVRTLEKKGETLSLTNNIATHTHRRRYVGQLISANNAMVQQAYVTNDTDTYELALAELRYYDPSTPGTLITADGASGTYSRDYFFTSVTMSLIATNNFTAPVKIRVYCLRPKQKTNKLPTTAYSEGLADQAGFGASPPSVTSPLMHVTDIDLFNKNWAIENSVSRTLTAGQSITLSCHEQKIKYNPAIIDSHAQIFRPDLKNRTFLVRIEGGILAHGSSPTTTVGRTQSGVDIEVDQKYVIRYDAGVELNDFTTSDGSGTGVKFDTKPLIAKDTYDNN